MYPVHERVRLVEVKFKGANPPVLSESAMRALKELNLRMWVNTLKVSHSADYTDKRAAKKPDDVWGTLIRKGVSVIQTDEPEILLDYLRGQNLHD